MSELERLQYQVRQSEEELRIAEVIQRSLLPESLPTVDGWYFDARYQPARVIGGDIYDFISLPAGLLGIVLGDASDKGIPAALVMATARALIRAAAARLVLPAQVLAQVNDDLAAQIPPGIYVTCFYGLLDLETGRFRYANAGQCAPILHSSQATEELVASGWPLGMLPGRTYDEGELIIEPGCSLVCYSDGFSETHGCDGKMLGTNGVVNALETMDNASSPIGRIISSRYEYALAGLEQEDDLTIISVTRAHETSTAAFDNADQRPVQLATLSFPSLPETERTVADQVLAHLTEVPLSQSQRERLHTAVAETFMNAAEHGNQFHPERPVEIVVERSESEVNVLVSDSGRGGPLPAPVTPNLDAKLAGLQSPRGWGLFLIREMVDSAEMLQTESGLTVRLTVHLTGMEDQSHV